VFKYIVGISSFLIASIAAFFSIKGISLLFAGSFWPVVLMASALEVGKLVATSSLYRYYHELNKLIRAYLFVAIVILMAITSLGIFGFLSDAFYRSKIKSEATSAKVIFIEEKKNTLQQKFDYNKERIKTLSDIRKSQEDRLTSITRQNTDVKKSGLFGTDQTVDTGALKAKAKSMDLVASEVQSANKEIDELSKNNETIMQGMDVVNNELLAIKQTESKETDIGTFKFIAKTFDVELDTAVKYFIISLVCVFDPLAVILLIIFNFLIKKK
jgi:hypothetical protein